MIPHTPILLVNLAHGLARHAGPLPREHPELPCSLEFVTSIGVTSHLDLQVGLSTWPVQWVRSFDDLRRLCVRRRWARLLVEAGDLLLLRNDAPRPDGEGEPPPAEEVAVVLEVLRHEPDTDGSVRQCLLAIARPNDHGRMQVETHLRWCDPRGRDLAIRWYATYDDIEHAA